MNINTAFPTIADKPRHQQYHVDNETSEATTQEINGQQKQFLTVIKSAKATFTHIDVHFTRGGEKSYDSLERAAKNKRKEYEAAHSYFLKLVVGSELIQLLLSIKYVVSNTTDDIFPLFP